MKGLNEIIFLVRKKFDHDRFFVLCLCIVCAAWFFTVFGHFHPINRADWDKVFTYHELSRKAVLEYCQLPFWNPYIGGGLPWLAHPESDFLSFFFLPVIFLGSILGVISVYLVQAFIAMLGVYALSRLYGAGRPFSLLSAVFVLNIFNIIAYVGSFTFLNISFLPWVLWFFKKAKEKVVYFWPIPFLLAHCVYSGSVYAFIIITMVLGIESLWGFILEKKYRAVILFIKALCVCLILAGPKLLPLYELMRLLPRHIQLPAMPVFLSPEVFSSFLRESGHFFFSRHNLYVDVFFSHEHMLGYNFPFITILALMAAPFLLRKERLSILIIGIISFFLALGDNSPVNLWRILHFFFSSYREPQMFFAPFVICWSVILGLVVQDLFRKLRLSRQGAVVLYTGILILVVGGVFLPADKIFKIDARPINYRTEVVCPQNDFSQTRGNHANMFDSIRANEGVVSGYDSIGNQIESKVIPRQENGYKGEYYLVGDSGQVGCRIFSPNLLVLDLNAAREDILVVNQNYFPGWHSFGKKVFSYHGLIGVRVLPADTKIVLYYLPSSFVWGFSGMILFICLCLGLFALKNSRTRFKEKT